MNQGESRSVARHALLGAVLSAGLLMTHSMKVGAAEGDPTALVSASAVSHYEYVLPGGSIYVYDIDNAFALVKRIDLPQTHPIRGATASPSTHILYVSFGGDGDGNGSGSMLALDLLTDMVVWSVDYPDGIDSMAITPDGKTIYMPTGELNPGKTWLVIDASDGSVVGSIDAGANPHNTLVSLDGTRVYMAPRDTNYLFVASTASNTLVGKIGPLRSGVRPFTINGRQTLAFTTATRFLGFEVSDIGSGQVLFRVPVAGFGVPPSFAEGAPSHGISLSPGEDEIWLMDGANSSVHVFDVSGLPGLPPRRVADLRLSRPLTGLVNPCTYDCLRSGWVQHSLDGRYVFVGDSGDVFDTTTRRAVINLEPLYNSRVHLEIDWQDGVPVATTTRYGMGYVTTDGPFIRTVALPAGRQSGRYRTTLAAAHGAFPYIWSVVSGSLPAGLNLGSVTGIISGTPTGTGTTSFTVQVTDADSQTATRPLSITIRPRRRGR